MGQIIHTESDLCTCSPHMYDKGRYIAYNEEKYSLSVNDPGSTEYLMENMENKSSIEENTEDFHDFTCLK